MLSAFGTIDMCNTIFYNKISLLIFYATLWLQLNSHSTFLTHVSNEVIQPYLLSPFYTHTSPNTPTIAITIMTTTLPTIDTLFALLIWTIITLVAAIQPKSKQLHTKIINNTNIFTHDKNINNANNLIKSHNETSNIGQLQN